VSRRRGTSVRMTQFSGKGTTERGYAIGERNPQTFPDRSGESREDNIRRSRSWTAHRKWAASIASTGAKY
jgi:hypothetical protein